MNECPMDGGEGAYLGPLGRLDWFRCISCGADYSMIRTEEEGDE